MKDIFSIAPQRLGGLDMLIPLFMEIKRIYPRTRIQMIFVESKPYQDLQRDPFLYGEFCNVVDNTSNLLGDQREERYTDVIRMTVRFLPILLRMIASPKFILLHDRGIYSPYMKILYRITKLMGGKVFEHFSSIVLLIGRKSRFSKNISNEGDGFLCFGPHDIPYLRSSGRKVIRPIGYTRLFKAWIERVRKMSKSMIEDECKQLGLSYNGNIVSLFLSSYVPGLFDISQFERWLQSAISVVKHYLPGATILVKPHPTNNMDHLINLLRRLDTENTGITHLHPCILAEKSDLVITHHSTTTMDSLAFETPTIQFQEFTEQWLKVHPEGSSYLQLGLLWAKTENELEKRVKQVMLGNFEIPDIREKLKHRENLALIMGEE